MRNFGVFIVDFLRLPKINPGNLDQFFEIQGLEIVRAERSKGKKILFLTAHLGNWELGAAAFALCGFPLTVVALPHSTRQVTDFFSARRRKRGIRMLSTEERPRRMARALMGSGFTALLGDRDFTGTGEYIEFFGASARLPSGPAKLARWTEGSLIPAFAIRKPDGRYRVEFTGPIPVQSTAHPRQDLAVNMERVARVLESWIGRYPEQWFVFDDLWA
jgi:KDO2-lipid IV(A) lauroyltransferase